MTAKRIRYMVAVCSTGGIAALLGCGGGGLFGGAALKSSTAAKLGSCCNDAGCVDDVLEMECDGIDETWEPYDPVTADVTASSDGDGSHSDGDSDSDSDSDSCNLDSDSGSDSGSDSDSDSDPDPPDPKGACCDTTNGTCDEVHMSDCPAENTFTEATCCKDVTCEPIGACCSLDVDGNTVCDDDFTLADCDAIPGTLIPGAVCSDNPCP
ncbi:MAG: hypothetical protein ACE5E6_00430 [Phycisphaerae bacterium]